MLVIVMDLTWAEDIFQMAFSYLFKTIFSGNKKVAF